MKSILRSYSCGLLAFFLLSGCSRHTVPHQSIQSNNIPIKTSDLNNTKEVENLVRKAGRYDSTQFSIDDKFSFVDENCRSLFNKIKPAAITKTDFNKDGRTDLLVIGNTNDRAHPVCLIDTGNNKFMVLEVNQASEQFCNVPVVGLTDSMPVILNYNYRMRCRLYDLKTTQIKVDTLVDTLIFRYGSIVEYFKKHAAQSVQKIEYKTRGCYGPCPEFDIVINADRTATYNAIRNNNSQGKFNGTIRVKDFNELTGMLNYVEWNNLHDKYAVCHTDDQTCILTVTFSNGQTKQIEDYGLHGTRMLQKIYKLLTDLRANQDWRR